MAVKSAAKKPAVHTKTAKKPEKAISSVRKLPAIERPYSTSQLVSDLATETGVPQGKIKAVFARLETLMAGHMKHKQPFSLLGLLKMQVVTKPATKARQGVNPRTGAPTKIPAKPAHPAVKLKALKKLKEMA
ncbi:Histone-like bacterial DNA-binding protein [Candidatus Glomeribacter gigasporarum BEG34]|uniref:Viral histone-like protein n=1 Tax=Candidatus Glomeribacter gigasporarum BEG34 TaxID=1070319 RepID=G2JBK4_9BURK|nr:HU family DNA-binding protein [Candidatus Glomeribacter gigasporarum]CCD30158.1 Histone-like bacterial DNA-binding protein [Candidatus Glomeribacter gigasporarum BEG34]